MYKRKFTQFELLQIRFWMVVLNCMGVLVAQAWGSKPEFVSFDSAMKKIEDFLNEINAIQ